MVAELPQLKSRPFLVEDPELIARLVEGLGFRVIRVRLPLEVENPEEAVLVQLTAQLGFSDLGAGSWAAFGDRLWDLLTAEDESPVAIFLEGLDRLIPSDLHGFVRIVHKLLSMTEGVGLADSLADLQVEYFFVGTWSSLSGPVP
ncbi:hypothetical protein ACFVT5_02015 [Streptomyces sp. NPDC058001]|uniref:hypothetical protein n=1 Tax=Streptomyces sp. NPDC058001 TaxID=3346300 RepID=UPI0036E75CD0